MSNNNKFVDNLSSSSSSSSDSDTPQIRLKKQLNYTSSSSHYQIKSNKLP